MLDDSALTDLLTRLDGIANAPMTAMQRETRAQQILAESGASVGQLVKAMRRYNLTWNRRKAEELDVTCDTWLQAARIVNQAPGESLGDMLERIHQMEAVVAMLRAGYICGRDAYGRLVWSR